MAIDTNLLKIIHSADIIINNLDLIDSDSHEKLNIPDDIADKIREELQSDNEWLKTLKADIDEACHFFKE